MGIYSSSQFLGIFLGGSLSGWIYTHFHAMGIFAFTIGLAAIWLGLAASMQIKAIKKQDRVKSEAQEAAPK